MPFVQGFLQPYITTDVCKRAIEKGVNYHNVLSVVVTQGSPYVLYDLVMWLHNSTSLFELPIEIFRNCAYKPEFETVLLRLLKVPMLYKNHIIIILAVLLRLYSGAYFSILSAEKVALIAHHISNVHPDTVVWLFGEMCSNPGVFERIPTSTMMMWFSKTLSIRPEHYETFSKAPSRYIKALIDKVDIDMDLWRYHSMKHGVLNQCLGSAPDVPVDLIIDALCHHKYHFYVTIQWMNEALNWLYDKNVFSKRPLKVETVGLVSNHVLQRMKRDIRMAQVRAAVRKLCQRHGITTYADFFMFKFAEPTVAFGHVRHSIKVYGVPRDVDIDFDMCTTFLDSIIARGQERRAAYRAMLYETNLAPEIIERTVAVM